METKKIRKSRTVSEKNRKGAPLVLSGFVDYVKKVKKWNGGPFALSFRWPDLVLVVSVKSGPFSVRSVVWRIRRERLKSALYLRLKKRKVLKICPGRIYEKLRKQFRDTQRVPFMLDKTLFHFSPTGNKKKTFFFENRIFSFGHCRMGAEKCEKGALWDLLTYILLQNIKKTRMGTLLIH